MYIACLQVVLLYIASLQEVQLYIACLQEVPLCILVSQLITLICWVTENFSCHSQVYINISQNMIFFLGFIIIIFLYNN